MGFEHWFNQSNQWLKNWYLSLPSQALAIIRIGQGLGKDWARTGQGLGKDWLAQGQDNVTEWDHGAGCLIFQHYKVAMSAHCQKFIPVLIWPWMLSGRKTTNNQQLSRLLTFPIIAIIAVQSVLGKPLLKGFSSTHTLHPHPWNIESRIHWQ